jgi:antiviral helicase SKI2
LVKGYKSALQARKDRVKFKLKRNMESNEWATLIEIMKKKKLIPLIVFSFSRKKCEESAFGLSTVDLTTSSEKSQIHVFFENSISRLSKVDRTLPQVIRMRDLLSRGIGVHHSGLLPIVKEIVEMLFGRGLLKVLFATETFAMGVNMPARCVVFNGLRKHDGKDFRDLLPAEFIQVICSIIYIDEWSCWKKRY